MLSTLNQIEDFFYSGSGVTPSEQTCSPLSVFFIVVQESPLVSRFALLKTAPSKHSCFHGGISSNSCAYTARRYTLNTRSASRAYTVP